jgi:hypothetical protein
MPKQCDRRRSPLATAARLLSDAFGACAQQMIPGEIKWARAPARVPRDCGGEAGAQGVLEDPRRDRGCAWRSSNARLRSVR